MFKLFEKQPIGHKTTDPRDGPTRSMFLDHLISAFVFMLPFGS
jgi:hypothetical protein